MVKKQFFMVLILIYLSAIIFSSGFLDTLQADFQGGSFNNTVANADDNVSLDNDGSNFYSSGDYNSQIFDSGSSNTRWDSLLWSEAGHYGEQLGDNNSASPQIDGNMSGNVLLLHLNENTTGAGQTIIDSSGENNNGTTFGDTDCTQTGKFSKACYFDGTGDYISITNSPELNPTGNMTITAWIKATTWETNNWEGTIVGHDDWNDGEPCDGYVLRTGDNGKLSTVVCNGTNWVGPMTGSVMSTGTWYHIGMKIDGAVISVYIDGVQRASITDPGFTMDPSEYSLEIGRSPYDTARLFNGYIDEVAIWNRALSDDEILKIYQRGALRLKFQARGCSDGTCSTNPTFIGPDNTSSTYFEDGNTSHDLNAFDENRFFQYKAFFETDDTNMLKGMTPYLLDVNITYSAINTSPDVNIISIDSNPESGNYPAFSYIKDGNLTIDFNIMDQDSGDYLTADINYSSSNNLGTGTQIVKDLNLSNGFCADTNFMDSTRCSYDFNISSSIVSSDGNYFILISLNDGTTTDFNAIGKSFMIDNTGPSVSITSPTNNSTQTSTTVNLEYSGSDTSTGIAKYFVSIDGTTWIDNSTNTTYSFTNQGIGAHTYYLKATDSADNNSSNASITLTIEETPAASPAPTCGDNVCNTNESCSSCPSDCGGCAYGSPRGNPSSGTKTNSNTNTTSEPEKKDLFFEKTYTEFSKVSVPIAENKTENQEEKRTTNEKELRITRGMKLSSNTQKGKHVNFNGKITVTIQNLAKKVLEEISVIENIPKEYAQSAAEIKSDYNFTVLENDPVIRFDFPEIKEGEKIEFSYYFTSSAEETEIEEKFYTMNAPLALVKTEPENCIGIMCNDFDDCTIDLCKNGECVFEKKCSENENCSEGKCTAKETTENGTINPEETQYNTVHLIAGTITIFAILFITAVIIIYFKNKKPKLGYP